MFVGIISFIIIIVVCMFGHYGAISYFMTEQKSRYNSIFVLIPLNILFFLADKWAGSFISVSSIQALKISGLMTIITILIVRFVLMRVMGVDYSKLNKSNIGTIKVKFLDKKRASFFMMIASAVAAVVIPIIFNITAGTSRPEFYTNDLVLLAFLCVMSAVYYFVAYKGYEELLVSVSEIAENKAVMKRDKGRKKKKKK